MRIDVLDRLTADGGNSLGTATAQWLSSYKAANWRLVELIDTLFLSSLYSPPSSFPLLFFLFLLPFPPLSPPLSPLFYNLSPLTWKKSPPSHPYMGYWLSLHLRNYCIRYIGADTDAVCTHPNQGTYVSLPHVTTLYGMWGGAVGTWQNNGLSLCKSGMLYVTILKIYIS